MLLCGHGFVTRPLAHWVCNLTRVICLVLHLPWLSVVKSDKLYPILNEQVAKLEYGRGIG